ncbi:MAG: hypothetical protein CL843_09125 [Crocinitomicaceae bacterium]|nr:hypothetical protein [Crocinitomicaceae bacterium]|tara:strand:+ start:1604 stop:2146 length:543 start_codon:yes stop_codon:yes gene_type:complete
MSKEKQVPILLGTELSGIQNINRNDIDNIKLSWVDKINNGECRAAELYTAITIINEVFNGQGSGKYKKPGVKDLIKDQLLDEVANDKSLTIGRFKFSSKETGVKYDYSHDPVWNDLNEKIENLKSQIKAREERLKTAVKPDLMRGIEAVTELDPNTGEVFEVLPPSKTSTTSPSVEYVKQ